MMVMLHLEMDVLQVARQNLDGLVAVNQVCVAETQIQLGVLLEGQALLVAVQVCV